MNMKSTTLILILSLTAFHSDALEIPVIHPNLIEEDGNLFFVEENKKYPLKPVNTKFSPEQLVGHPKGSQEGIQFNFGNLNGTLYYGFIKPKDGRYPQPVFYQSSSSINKGKANINISSNLSGRYDMINWKENQVGTIGYRVAASNGTLLYDGKLAFTGNGPFQVNPASIIEGPFVNFSPEGTFHHTIRISFDTLTATTATITISPLPNEAPNYTFKGETPATHHEITLNNLQPDMTYSYTVQTYHDEKSYRENYTFQTAPLPGTRKPFTFAYASDSRHAQGGGERRIEGTNAYMMKKIAALVNFKQAAFMQFTGDLINGYLNSVEQTQVEYRNWKRAIEPFAHYLPIITTMGNHEALMHTFTNGVQIDRFPYSTDSAEAIFASQFVNPTNGPDSEDGAPYDPNPEQQDFPSYQENVFYYLYDNIAMIVLNSDYWYAPSLEQHPNAGGNLHGYLMDQQLEWLETTLATLEKNAQIDFIFVTHHTPAFPNGGHVGDDMWYRGNNEPRAVVKHTAAGDNLITKGIIEQRDSYLTILMNSPKVIGLLTGDEHNFSFLPIHQDMNIYPNNWDKEDIRQHKNFRTLYQVNNGAAGAPYAAEEATPWKEHLQSFTTQNAVVFFHIHGKSIEMEVINPDTLGTIWP